MEIESVSHKNLRRFIETGKARGLPGDVDRLRKMVTFLLSVETVEELGVPPNYGFHELPGNRAGTCSMIVTRNWRMTFRIENDAIIDLDLEDYH